MADNGNRGSNESFRRNQNPRKRRDPPIIDATATDVSPPASPSEGSSPETAAEPLAETAPTPSAIETDAIPSSTEGVAEPVLFGHPAPDVSSLGRDDTGHAGEHARPPVSDPAGGDTTAVAEADDATPPIEEAPRVPEGGLNTTPEDITEMPATAALSEPPATAEPQAADEPAGIADRAVFRPPEPPRRSPVPIVLGVVILALLAGIVGLLLTEPQRSGAGELAAEVGKLKDQVAALEARPQAADQGPKISALDGKTTSLADDVAKLKGALVDLGGKVGSASDEAQGNAGRIAALEQKVAGTSAAAQAAPSSAPAAATPSAGAAPAAGEPQAAAATPPSASAADLSALAAKVDALEKRVAALPSEVPAAPAATATPPASGTPAASATPAGGEAIDSKLNDLAGRVDALQANVAAIPKVDLAPLQSRFDDLDHRLTDVDQHGAAMSAALAALPKLDISPLQAATADLDKRVASLETALSAPKAGDRVTEARAVGDSDTARAAPLAVVAQAVTRAIDDGRPFEPEIDALKALGVDEATLAPLTPLAGKGAPTIEALKAQWTSLEPDVLKAMRPKGGTVLDRFAAGARSLVQVRPVGAAATGEDPVSLTGRIDAALDRGDLGDALAEWAKLPEDGRAASQGWADAARSRLDAGTAAQSLVSRAITMLGKAGG